MAIDSAFILLGSIPGAVCTGIVLSFLLDRLVEPRPKPFWAFVAGAAQIHVGIWLILFLVGFTILRRPWLSMALALAMQLCMILINNAKYHSLREPFLYQDIDYFVDIARHPRLYLPFFGWMRFIVASLCFAVVFFGGVWLESPINDTLSNSEIIGAGAALFCLSVLLVLAGAGKAHVLTFQPGEDIRMTGLFAGLVYYYLAERKPIVDLPANPALLNNCPGGEGSSRPHVVVVQSESFFDPRREYSWVKPEVLSGFDDLCREACAFGVLDVCAWGANTVRTEFSFLTGIRSENLGIDQFNPYRRAALRKLSTIVHQFRERGYQTICIHPYDGAFYRRDRILPLLGFDRFLDIRDFAVSDTAGPFIPDEHVSRKIADVIDASSGQPVFIFAITMENHGPLHLEPPPVDGQTRWVQSVFPEGLKHEMAVYLEHLANADRMMKHLRATLTRPDRPGVLAWYGDHVPIMSDAYKILGAPAGQTDYFIWRSDCLSHRTGRCKSRQIAVHDLAEELLRHIDCRSKF